jgi:hypothetical protein
MEYTAGKVSTMELALFKVALALVIPIDELLDVETPRCRQFGSPTTTSPQ